VKAKLIVSRICLVVALVMEVLTTILLKVLKIISHSDKDLEAIFKEALGKIKTPSISVETQCSKRWL